MKTLLIRHRSYFGDSGSEGGSERRPYRLNTNDFAYHAHAIGSLVGAFQHPALAVLHAQADALLNPAEALRQKGSSNNSGAKRSGGTAAFTSAP